MLDALEAFVDFGYGVGGLLFFCRLPAGLALGAYLVKHLLFGLPYARAGYAAFHAHVGLHPNRRRMDGPDNLS